MTDLFARAGVDYGQWKALVVTSLKLDLRQGAIAGGGTRHLRSTVVVLVGQAAFYTLYGGFLAFLFWVTRDLFFAATIAMTYVMFMVGTIILLDHNSALTSPADYAILGCRPVTSRTYFAARLTNVLVYTTALTTLVGYVPIVAVFIRYGLAVGFAGLAAFYLCSLSTALAILFSYAWLLRFIGGDRLRRAFSYLQLVLSFIVYGGFFFVQRLGSGDGLASMTLTRTPLLLLYPATWFAGYYEIGAGRAGATDIVTAVVSLFVLAGMVAGLGGRLSFEYSERLGAMAAASGAPRVRRARRTYSLGFRTGEDRAVALLIGSQFRNDQKFRMSVLSILPMTLIYLLMGVTDSNARSGIGGSSGAASYSLVNVAVMIFPSMLNFALTRSDAFRASWVFFAAPADRARLIRAAKNVLVALFLVPYLLFIGVIYLFLLGTPLQVAAHVILLGLLSHLLLQVIVLMDPALPFSRPNLPLRRSGSFMVFLVVMGVTSGLTQVLGHAIQESVIVTLVTFGVLGAVSVGIDHITRARVERQARSLEFEG